MTLPHNQPTEWLMPGNMFGSIVLVVLYALTIWLVVWLVRTVDSIRRSLQEISASVRTLATREGVGPDGE